MTSYHINKVPLGYFIEKYKEDAREESDAKIFWNELIHDVIGVPKSNKKFIKYEEPVEIDGNVKKIDAFIPSTRVLIEHKSANRDLDEKIHQSGGVFLTAFEQAKRYNDALGTDNRARWIVTCNFKKIRIYDVRTMAYPEPQEIKLTDLRKQVNRLLFLVDPENSDVEETPEVTKEAASKIRDLYEELFPREDSLNYDKKIHDLNIVCVRLVFCFYCENTELFGREKLLRKYIENHKFSLRLSIQKLFEYLNLDREGRLKDNSHYEKDTPDLASFPYINGGLFKDKSVDVDDFKDNAPAFLATAVAHDWENINPTIFGGLFESTLDPKSRRYAGMHYTTEENIKKVIFPLFLDDLKSEFERIRNTGMPLLEKEEKLLNFQDKIAKLKFLDPACGSGNFLTFSYTLLRRLENEVLKELPENKRQIKISIENFYGIEINDYAVAVARVALWIAEHQMIKESEGILPVLPKFFPLHSYPNIIEGNALKIEWRNVCPDVDYIIGNPPFRGASEMSNEQKLEAIAIFGKGQRVNSIDYVGAWYYKTAKYIQGTNIQCCFVSTNSITQGEQVAPLWEKLFIKYNIRINFAYRTFKWYSESTQMAQVHCVVIGFAVFDREKKYIYLNEKDRIEAQNINPYLLNAPTVFISARTAPICEVPKATYGNKPSDGGNLILSEEQKNEIIKKDPSIAPLIRRYIIAKDFLRDNSNFKKKRYCLWLKDVEPAKYRDNKQIIDRLHKIEKTRKESTAEPTRKSAETPHLFFSITQVENTNYLIIPEISGERKYIPMAFSLPDVIYSNKVLIVPNANLYHFGVLTSIVSMAWVRTVAGRLGTGYIYSPSIVYNNFPWPTPTEEQKKKIETTAQAILNARDLEPDVTLVKMYGNDMITFPNLRKAHKANDLAVLEAYGFTESMSELDIIAELMNLYQKLTT